MPVVETVAVDHDGVRLLVEKDGKWEERRSFAAEARDATVRIKPPDFSRQRVAPAMSPPATTRLSSTAAPVGSTGRMEWSTATPVRNSGWSAQ